MSEIPYYVRTATVTTLADTDYIIVDDPNSDVAKKIAYSDFVSLIGSDVTIDLGNIVFVSSKSELPTAVEGVITLAANITYYFTTTVDLTGDRLVGGANTVILGSSSENSRITSTGLGAGVPLFYTEWTTPVRHVTFQDVDTAIQLI